MSSICVVKKLIVAIRMLQPHISKKGFALDMLVEESIESSEYLNLR